MTARAERASQQLYEDASLRGDLTDSEAAPLLKWGELEVARLDARNPDEAAFEEALASLRRLLKTINRFVGQLAYSTPDEQAAAMDKISEHARTLGYNLPPDAFKLNTPASLMSAQSASDNLAVLSSLLAMIDNSVGGASTEVAHAPDNAPAEVALSQSVDASQTDDAPTTTSPLEQLARRLQSRTAYTATSGESAADDPPPAPPSNPSSGETQ